MPDKFPPECRTWIQGELTPWPLWTVLAWCSPCCHTCAAGLEPRQPDAGTPLTPPNGSYPALSRITTLSPCAVSSSVLLHTNNSFKDLENANPWKNCVIQMPWNLSGIYNKVYSLVYTNKFDSPRECFRILQFQSWVTKWHIEIEYLVTRFHQERKQQHVVW